MSETYKEKLERLLSHPDAVDTVCNFVANGGTAVSLANQWEIRFSDLTKWLYDDQARFDRYKNALNARGEWYIERILTEIKNLSFEEQEISKKDKLRAIELLGKHKAMFTDKVDHTGSVTLATLIGSADDGKEDK